MTSISASSFRCWPSSVFSASPFCASRTRRCRPASRSQVERVHRVPQLEEHVVGDVDDVVDRADAGRGEPLGEPGGRRADADVSDGGAVARASRGVLYRDAQGLDRVGRHRAQVGVRGHAARRVVARRDLARQPDQAQAVGPVRRDFEIDDGVVVGDVSRRTGTGDSPDRRRPRSPPCAGRVRAAAALTGTSTSSRSQETRTFTAGTAPGSAGRSRRTGGCLPRRASAARAARCRRRRRSP